MKLDGWTNLFTMMGTRKDRSAHTAFYDSLILGERELSALYRSGGIGRRIVDIIPDEATRPWIELPKDKSGELAREFKRLKIKQHTRQAWRWARLFGGAVIVLGVKDRGMLDQPLAEGRHEIDFIRVYDRHRVDFTSSDMVNDPSRAEHGMVEFYNISPIEGLPYRVHHSRLIVLEGEDLPDQDRVQNNGWGDSVVQQIYDDLRNFCTSNKASANIIADFIQTVISMKGLQSLIAGGQESVVLQRLNLIDMARSVFNTVLLDENEQYTKQASTVTGLVDVLDRLGGVLSGCTGIPQTKLFGRSPAGMNATGESDMKNWHNKLDEEREENLRPVLERILQIMTGGDDQEIKFRSLDTPTDRETAELRKVVSEMDERYVLMGAVDSVEVRKSRFKPEGYSMETTLDASVKIEDTEDVNDEKESDDGA